MGTRETGVNSGGPHGELTTRTVAMPADTNANGDIFGGWLLSQMDIAGGLAAKRLAGGRVATIAIESMKFHLPVFVGDTLSVFVGLKRIGTTSMAFRVEAWVNRFSDGDLEKVTEGVFTYVAIDDKRRPRPVPRNP
ncbi:MAG: acyl-CoA thioesterase [Alphaproteobacteria bacterium]